MKLRFRLWTAIVLLCLLCAHINVFAEEFVVNGLMNIDVDLSGISDDREKAVKICEALLKLEFNPEVAHKLGSLDNVDGIWKAHYAWEDKNLVKQGMVMGHVFDAKIDLKNRKISYTRCQ